MSNYFISDNTINYIIKKNNIKVTEETTHEEMLQIMLKIIIAAINEMDVDSIYDVIMDRIRVETRL